MKIKKRNFKTEKQQHFQPNENPEMAKNECIVLT